MLHSEATCIYLDHYGISKFGSRFSHGFDLVCAVIQDFVNRAPRVISSRWEGEGTKIRFQNNIPVSAKPSNKDKAPHSLSGRGCYVDESTSRLFTGSGSGAPTATVESCSTEEGTSEPNMDLQVPKKPLWTPSVASSEEIGDPGAENYFDIKFDQCPNQRASVNEQSQVRPHSIDAPEIHSCQTALGPEMEYPRRRKRMLPKSTSDTKRGRGEPSKVDNKVDKFAREMPANIQTGQVARDSIPSLTPPTTIPFGPYLPDVVLPPSPGMFRPSESSSEPLDDLGDVIGRYRESPPQSRLLPRPSPPFEVQQYPVELAPLRNYAQHHYGNQSRDPVAYHPYQSPNYRYMPANNVPAPSNGQEPPIYIHSPEQSSSFDFDRVLGSLEAHRSQAQFIQNRQAQAASLNIGQTLNYHTSDTDLGQPCVSDLTDDQVRRMDDHNFPAGFRYMNGALSAMPMDVKTSGMYIQQQQQQQQQQAQSIQAHPVMLVQQQTPSNPGHAGLLGQQHAQSSQDHLGMYVQRQAQSNPDHSGLLEQQHARQQHAQSNQDHRRMYVQQQAQSNSDHPRLLEPQHASSNQDHLGMYVQQQALQQQAQSSPDHLGMLGQQQAQSSPDHPGLLGQQQAQSNQSYPRKGRDTLAARNPQQQPQYRKYKRLPAKNFSASSTSQDSIELPASERPNIASKRPRIADAKLCASSPISSTGMGWEPEEWTSPKNRGDSRNYDYAFLPPPPLSPPVSELQTLDATEEERVKAREEVLQLLRQWTTCDTSQFTERGKENFINVGVGVGIAPPAY